MYSRLSIQTRVTVIEAEEVLRRLVRPQTLARHPPDPDRATVGGADPPFVGWVEGHRFKFHRIIPYRNSFVPIVSGKIVPGEGGAILRGRLRLAHVVAVVMALWMAITASLAIASLAHVGETSNAVAAVFPVAMPLFGAVLVGVGFLPERRKALRLLSQAFGSPREP
jgi:hypothetical protein